MKKVITVVTPCFNEEENVFDIYKQVKNVFSKLQAYDYKHLFIDNASTDNTKQYLRELANQDSNVQLILNNRNFGHIRSPYHGLIEAKGDAVILIAADLQEPVELIFDFISKWEDGYDIVIGVKPESKESKLFFFIRKIYYFLVTLIAEVDLIKNFTGFGLYDRKVLDALKKLEEPSPYLRGLVSELGFNIYQLPFVQEKRKRGFSKNNFYALYDMAMLGFTSHSKVPLRMASIAGGIISIISLCISLFYLVRKLIDWDSFSLGIAPLVIGFFFFGAIQLLFLGLLGEYVMQVLDQTKKRPLVFERERINFD
jgi:glycosyltransferase involved in cell wall biosynthesis